MTKIISYINYIVIAALFFSISTYAESKKNEYFSFNDLVGMCINGMTNLQSLDNDFKYIGTKELKKSYFKDELDIYGYKGRAYLDKENKKLYMIYFGKKEGRHVCGVVSGDENYSDVLNKMKSSFTLKLYDEEIKMGPKTEVMYKIKHASFENVFLNISKSTGAKTGQLKYDIVAN